MIGILPARTLIGLPNRHHKNPVKGSNSHPETRKSPQASIAGFRFTLALSGRVLRLPYIYRTGIYF